MDPPCEDYLADGSRDEVSWSFTDQLVTQLPGVAVAVLIQITGGQAITHCIAEPGEAEVEKRKTLILSSIIPSSYSSILNRTK